MNLWQIFYHKFNKNEILQIGSLDFTVTAMEWAMEKIWMMPPWPGKWEIYYLEMLLVLADLLDWWDQNWNLGINVIYAYAFITVNEIESHTPVFPLGYHNLGNKGSLPIPWHKVKIATDCLSTNNCTVGLLVLACPKCKQKLLLASEPCRLHGF